MKIPKCFFPLLLAAAGISAAEIKLEPSQLETRGKAEVRTEGSEIFLSSDTPEWDAGLRINPPAGKKFDFSSGRFLAVDVTNLSPDRQLRLTMHISSGKKRERSTSHVDLPLREVNTGIGLNPGEKRTMRLYLPHASLFTPPKGGKNIRRPLDTAGINSIDFKMQWAFEPQRKDLIKCSLSNFRLEGTPELDRKVNKDAYFPFIDAYGQYKHSEWKEKIHSDEELKTRHAEELKQLAGTPAPSAWNRYGGWADGPKLKATGFFRLEKYEGNWYFVDPSGSLFWSFGIDVLRNNTDSTRGERNPGWFDTKIPEDGLLPFTDWNLRIKYGKKDYLEDFYKVLAKRLGAWGINTIGNWGANEFMELGKIPYVLTLGERIKGIPALSPKGFSYDVFAPEFESVMGNILSRKAGENSMIAKSVRDPMCIGYFIDNELKFKDIIRGVISGPSSQYAKQEFRKDLKEKYGSIEKLNGSWKTEYRSWDDFLSGTAMPKRTKEFRKDSDAFYAKFVNRYFEICRKGIKKTAPHRLYLGSRFVGFRQPDSLWKAAAEHCDAVSVNTYCNSVHNVNRADFRGKPVLIGEFHFGTYDRGMFSASLCPVGDQKERAVSLTRFIQGALMVPEFVGAHYFQFRDQPLTGRYDGEGYQIGFADVADTPYPEMTEASREIGANMYTYRTNGKLTNTMK